MIYSYPASLKVKFHVLATPLYAMQVSVLPLAIEEPFLGGFFVVLIVLTLWLAYSTVSRPVIEITDGVVYCYRRLSIKKYRFKLGRVSDIQVILNKKDMYLRVPGKQDFIIENHYLKQAGWHALVGKLRENGLDVCT